MIVDNIAIQEQVPTVWYNKSLRWYFGSIHVFTQLTYSPETLYFANLPIKFEENWLSLYHEVLHFEEDILLNVLKFPIYISILIVKLFCQFVGVESAWPIGKLKVPVLKVKLFRKLSLKVDFDKIAYLSHEYDMKIEIPLLSLCDEGQNMRHIVVGSFELIQNSVNTIFNSKRTKIKSLLKHIEELE